jgi:hypothetical protein
VGGGFFKVSLQLARLFLRGHFMELFSYSKKESVLAKKIYALLEKHVRSETDGEFTHDYALHNTDVTELVQDLICNCRNQIQWENQCKTYRG